MNNAIRVVCCRSGGASRRFLKEAMANTISSSPSHSPATRSVQNENYFFINLICLNQCQLNQNRPIPKP
jgi:hypothetical protein